MEDGRKLIFVGYRHEDSPDAVERICDRLHMEYGSAAVFRDVGKIPPGADFRDHILKKLPSCRAFLAMIGPGWVSPRLQKPEDLVRIELETALAAGSSLKLIPVLLNGAHMPRTEELPASLHGLLDRQAAYARRGDDFHRDVDTLIEQIGPSELLVRTAIALPRAYHGEQGPIYVAGTFNNWLNPKASRIKPDPAFLVGLFSQDEMGASLLLPPGTHEFKFVTAGNKWLGWRADCGFGCGTLPPGDNMQIRVVVL